MIHISDLLSTSEGSLLRKELEIAPLHCYVRSNFPLNFNYRGHVQKYVLNLKRYSHPSQVFPLGSITFTLVPGILDFC